MPSQTNSPIAPVLLSMKELTAYVNITRGQIYSMLREKSGAFPTQLKIGKTARWRKCDIDAWLERMAAEQGLTTDVGV